MNVFFKSAGAPGRSDPGQAMKLLVGRLIDGTGGPSVPNMLMTVETGCIVGMRSVSNDEMPTEDSWCDLSGYTVLPPFFDCHVHLAISGSLYTDRQTCRRSPEYESLLPVISRHVHDHLRCGVLGVRDGGDPLGLALRYKLSDPELKRFMFRVCAAGSAWHREGRYGKLMGRAVPEGEDPAAMIEVETGPGVDHIKLIQSGLNSLTHFGKQTRPQFDEDAIRKIYTFTRKRGLGLMVHANGEAPVAVAIAGGCDSIEHGYFMGDENLRKMADARITWVPTAVPMKAYADHASRGSIECDVARKTLDHQLAQLTRARQYGVPVALGTDAGSPGVEHGKAVAQELKLFVEAGYTVEEAISCATMNAARLMGKDTPGYLGIGTPASFIALKGTHSDVLETLGRVEKVMVSGRVVGIENA